MKTPRSRLYTVQEIVDVRWNSALHTHEYLTKWQGYAKKSWNLSKDFGPEFDGILLLTDFLSVATPQQELTEAAKLLQQLIN